MVANVRQRGSQWAQMDHFGFGTVIANDSHRADVETGHRPKDSSKEADGALKPLAIFTVYTFATAAGAKEKK
jgi:hypothetical protein